MDATWARMLKKIAVGQIAGGTETDQLGGLTCPKLQGRESFIVTDTDDVPQNLEPGAIREAKPMASLPPVPSTQQEQDVHDLSEASPEPGG